MGLFSHPRQPKGHRKQSVLFELKFSKYLKSKSVSP